MHDTPLRKIWRYAAATSLVTLILLFAYGTPLPKEGAILPIVAKSTPTQTDFSETREVSKKIGEYTYTFTPRAEYQIHGLVVSLHHSDSWIDISHEDDPAQTMDICVVWGTNIANGSYREVKYSHGDWTCYVEWKNNDTVRFNMTEISNNHLIPKNKEEAKLIKSIRVGDQIVLSGELSEYSVLDKDGRTVVTRGTSLIRSDTGNGACETIHLTDAKVLKRNMPWRTPLMHLLLFIIFLFIPFEIYWGIPKYSKGEDTITGKPHVENPYDIKNFVKKNTRASSAPSNNKDPLVHPTNNREDTPEKQ